MTCNAVFYDETVPDDIKRVLQSHEVEVQHNIEDNARLIWRHEDWDQDRKLCVLYKGTVSDQCCLAEFSPDEIQGSFEKVRTRIFDGDKHGYTRLRERNVVEQIQAYRG